MQLTLRNASLTELASELREQQDRKVDMIVPARDLWSHNGHVLLRGMGEAKITDNGVDRENLYLAPSDVFDAGLSAKLSEPGRPFSRAYLRGLRDTGRTDLVDANINGLLHGNSGLNVPSDPRRFLVRTFAGKDGGTGYARALLSDSYKTIDNWDVLNAAIKGMTDAGLDAHVVRSADLTNNRMYVRVMVPEISMLAPELLDGYVSPYSRNRGADNPTVFAGFKLSNSETGGGAFTITPELTVEICTNGMTITKDAVSKRHLGSKLEDDGVVRHSDRTQRLNLDLITSQTTDAVRTFLDVDYMRRVIRSMTAKASEAVAKPEEVITTVVKRAAFTKEDADGIMDAFIRGASMTRGGVFQAITAYSQTINDADRAHEMDADALAAAGLSGVTGTPVRV